MSQIVTKYLLSLMEYRPALDHLNQPTSGTMEILDQPMKAKHPKILTVGSIQNQTTTVQLVREKDLLTPMHLGNRVVVNLRTKLRHWTLTAPNYQKMGLSAGVQMFLDHLRTQTHLTLLNSLIQAEGKARTP